MSIPKYVIDVEASGLSSNSYPIEIGWGHRADSKSCGSFLINPIPEWIHWDDYAENYIHKISRFELKQYGIGVLAAANRLNASLQGEKVLSDAAEYDRVWIKKLFNFAGVEMRFLVVSIYDYMEPSKAELFTSRIETAGVQHRALADVRQLIDCLNYFSPL